MTNTSSKIVVVVTVVALFFFSSTATAYESILVVTPSENGSKTLNLFYSVKTVEENSPLMFMGPGEEEIENVNLEVFVRGENGYSPIELRVSNGVHLLSHPGFLVGRVSAPDYSETWFVVMVKREATKGIKKARFGTIKAEKPPNVGEIVAFRALDENGSSMNDVEIVVEDPDAGKFGRQKGSSPLSAYVASKDFSVTAFRREKLVGTRQFNLEDKGDKGESLPLTVLALVGLVVVLGGIIYKKRPSRPNQPSMPNMPSKSDVPWGWIAIIVTGIIAIWLLI